RLTAQTRLLLVVLDRLGAADVGVVGVLAVLTLGPALAQQVPALIEHHLDVLEAVVVTVLALLADRVLLVGERPQLVEDRLIVHRQRCYGRSVTCPQR